MKHLELNFIIAPINQALFKRHFISIGLVSKLEPLLSITDTKHKKLDVKYGGKWQNLGE